MSIGGEKLKKRRQYEPWAIEVKSELLRRGLNQYDLSEMIGIRWETISRALSGRNPSQRIKQLACEALNINVNQN